MFQLISQISPYCRRKQVFMVDFANGTNLNYDLEKNIVYEGRIPNIPNPSFMYPLKFRPNQFIVSDNLSTTIVVWNGMDTEARVVQEAFTVETAPEYAQNNWNQARASPQNTFFARTYRRGIILKRNMKYLQIFSIYSIPYIIMYIKIIVRYVRR